MQPQLTLLTNGDLAKDDASKEDAAKSDGTLPLMVDGGKSIAGRRRAVDEPVRNAARIRSGRFGLLSQRTCQTGRRRVAAAKARLAALPEQPDIDLGAA